MFHFDIQKNYFYAALDRFAQFFIEPLMKKGSVDRELEAVDSGNLHLFFVCVVVTVDSNRNIGKIAVGRSSSIRMPSGAWLGLRKLSVVWLLLVVIQ